MWVIAALYVAVMVVGIMWLIQRIVRYVHYTRARRVAEEMLTEQFQEDDFQSYLETLRQQRKNDDSSIAAAIKDE
jgi:hypothetical protein